jgi:predicted O-methyltransferase YrrM
MNESIVTRIAQQAAAKAVSTVPAWCRERPHAHEPYYTFLHAFVAQRKPKLVVELGVDTGTSGCFLATGSRETRVISVELDERSVANLRGLAVEHHLDNLTVLHGSSTDLQIARDIRAAGPIDLLFIDTLHTFAQASAEYRLYRPMMSKDGLIVHDDLGLGPEMAAYWRSVREPKLELPMLHHSGFGASWRQDLTTLARRSEGPYDSLHYRGVSAAQHLRVLSSLDALADATCADPFETIVEIGTHLGGFTRLLRDHPVSDGCERIVSIDIERMTEDIEDVGLVTADVWASGLVHEHLQTGKRTALLCDGGDKIREVNTFAPSMHRGDVILCHDYGRTREGFDTSQWPSCEITYADIAGVLERHGFEPFLAEEMGRSFWGCFVKRR